MIMAFLTARGFLGLAKGIWLLGAIVAVLGAVWWLKAAEKADDRANQEIGATKQREGDLRTTIERTEKANDAAETVRRDPGAARDECLRNARNPADC